MNSVEDPNFLLLSAHPEWRNDWTHIIAGQFSSSLYSSLLFYEQSTGHAEFYETDGNGGMSLLSQYDDWGTSWTLIVPGCFAKSSFLPPNRQPANTGFFLYDQQAGFGAFYNTDGHGGLIKIAEWNDWRTTWTHIIAGTFTDSPFSGLLFYEQPTGEAEMHSVDGHGGMTLIQAYSEWRTSWTHIVPGEFYNDGSVYESTITDLFFYEGSTGYGETYANDGQGGLTLVGSQQMPPATIILPGCFGGTEWTNLLFYDPASGTGSFQELSYPGGDPPTGVWSSSENYTGWREDWDLIVPGNFWMADPEDVYFPDGGFTDLMFYERAAGYGEFYLHEPPSPTVVEPLAGYASARSLFPGDTIQFFVASQVGPYRIHIYLQGIERISMADLDCTPADPLPIHRLAYRDGAGWPPVATFTIPQDWPSGLYFAQVYVSLNVTPPFGGGLLTTEKMVQRNVQPFDIPFVIRPPIAAQSARILLVIPDTTYQAYNFWGGRSLYGYGHNGSYGWAYPQTSLRVPYAFRVSFLRPHDGLGTQGPDWQYAEVPLIQWMGRQAILAEYAVASDLDDAAALDFLECYRLVVVVGHSEYWSLNMKHNLQQYINKGGNVAFLGGNICYWQIRFENDPEAGPKMVCYKQAPFDPNSSGNSNDQKTVTTLWSNFPNDTDTELTGVSYQWVDYPNLPEYQVLDPSHWIFANTGLQNGDSFGLYDNNQQTVLGPETDSRRPTTPANFQLLASLLVDTYEVASMGVMANGGTVLGVTVNGGTVFTAATINWTQGLSQDDSWNAVDQITRNVLIKLGS